MYNKKSVMLALCAMLSVGNHAVADDGVDRFLSLSLEELMALEVTISTNTKQSLNQAPSVITVITQKDIQATGATNLVDVLEGVPGVHIRASHFGFRPLIQFRGANATQTLLMVNGVPMRDLMWGFGIFWKGLQASGIERVEIIRGPGSALFGADASAGVINVITKTAGTIEESEAGLRAGSYNSRSAWVQYGGKWNGYQIGMTADVSSTDGHAPLITQDQQSLVDPAVSYAPDEAAYGWQGEEFRLAVAKGAWRLQADYLSHGDLETGMTGAGVLDPVTRASDSRYNLDLLYHNEEFSDNWGVDAQLRYHHLEYDSGDGFQERPPGYIHTDNNGTPLDPSDDIQTLYPDGKFNHMSSAERRTILEVGGLYHGVSNHLIKVGAGRTWQDLYYVGHTVTSPTDPSQLLDVSDTTAAFAPEKMRTISHLYLQDEWRITDGVQLTAGVRYDDYSDFGDSTNPRLALVWQSTPRLTTKLMYGEAFRPPSYQELYSTTSNAQPNEALGPERSQTTDLAFVYAASRDLQLNLNLFTYKQVDLIRATGTPRQFQNVGDHTIQGVELEMMWQAARNLSVAANYTLRVQDESDYRAFDEPNEDAYLRLDWGFRPHWHWNLQHHWIGERERPDTDSRTTLAGYQLTDTTLRYEHDKHWEFAASIRNLFDSDAREYTGASIPGDLPLPGRNGYVELRYHLGNE